MSEAASLQRRVAASPSREQLSRQVAHWSLAARRLAELDELASPAAWSALESYLGVAVRRELQRVLDRLEKQAELLQSAFKAAETERDLEQVRARLLFFRVLYLRAETTLDFYADAINTRTSPKIGGLLRACDTIAHRAMAQALDPLGKKTPVVLTYIDKGLGASILKAGLRLWDGTSANPAAAIKITRHNLYRPTSLIHEVGHQVAHILGWNEELALVLREGLGSNPELADVWASWSAEIAADAFALVHTGYASVAGLHDVLAGDPSYVMRFSPGDPHPVAFIRVLLNVETCRIFYGAGPWDNLAAAWREQYPLSRAPGRLRSVLEQSLPLLPEIVALTFKRAMRAFNGRPLIAVIDPNRVSPQSLDAMERELGPALYTSMHWVWTEAVRTLALTGYRAATQPERSTELNANYEAWMMRLSGGRIADKGEQS